MNKLIKLSDTHYIVVDDSNIKKGDYCFINNEIHQVENFNDGVLPEHIHKYGDAINTCYNIKIGHYVCFPESLIGKKITHSTQPIEKIPLDVQMVTSANDVEFINIKPLSLSEVEEAIYGYNLEKMALEYDGRMKLDIEFIRAAFKAGFNKHKELVKDKLFTIDDIALAFRTGIEHGINPKKINTTEYIKSLLPKTEWDIKFDEQGKIKLI